ncbi:MAG: hypothetical protein KKF80_01490 [Candidatus Omnitrophica bacterium]|nr:hypothetical protein [Candidatus Omnitrophota bacterium]
MNTTTDPLGIEDENGARCIRAHSRFWCVHPILTSLTTKKYDGLFGGGIFHYLKRSKEK